MARAPRRPAKAPAEPTAAEQQVIAEAPGEAAAAADVAPTANQADAPAAPTAPDTQPVAAPAPEVGPSGDAATDATASADAPAAESSDKES
jgi:hypothetical protein